MISRQTCSCKQQKIMNLGNITCDYEFCPGFKLQQGIRKGSSPGFLRRFPGNLQCLAWRITIAGSFSKGKFQVSGFPRKFNAGVWRKKRVPADTDFLSTYIPSLVVGIEKR